MSHSHAVSTVIRVPEDAIDLMDNGLINSADNKRRTMRSFIERNLCTLTPTRHVWGCMSVSRGETSGRDGRLHKEPMANVSPLQTFHEYCHQGLRSPDSHVIAARKCRTLMTPVRYKESAEI
jgi:hypothetical protein